MQERTYKNYLLILIIFILASNWMDRLALGIMLQDIKADLHLSDTQLGLMTGIAFSLFYALVGIPIARWADRGNRVAILSLATALWSIAVALCGFAGNFVQLLLMRVAVGIGEAGYGPPVGSLVADYFKRAERARAAGIYSMGGPLSLVFGFFAAGWLNQLYGWRTTFMILGMPGLALALLTWRTVREPRKLAPRRVVPQPSIKATWGTLWRILTFRRMLLGFAVSNFFVYGIVQWQPTFFIRSYGMQAGEVGSWFAIAYGLSGLLGAYAGGVLASRYAAHNERLQLKAIAIMMGGFGFLSACVYLAPDKYWALLFMGLACLGLSATNGAFMAIMQTVVPSNMIGMSTAMVLLFTNLIGMGLGPLAVGALSDELRPWLGEESLRYSLLALCPGILWCLRQMWRASETVAQDLGVPADHDLQVQRKDAEPQEIADTAPVSLK